jgi:hypothetical protein
MGPTDVGFGGKRHRPELAFVTTTARAPRRLAYGPPANGRRSALSRGEMHVSDFEVSDEPFHERRLPREIDVDPHHLAPVTPGCEALRA